MNLAERHIVKSSNKLFRACDRESFLSKNLHNATTYELRQAFFDKNKKMPSYKDLAGLFAASNNPDFRALPAKVSQWTMKRVFQAFKDFFALSKAYKEKPNKFTGKPQLPKYKHKTKGRALVTYTIQAISKPKLKQGIIKLSGCDIEFKTKCVPSSIKQVRIVPEYGHYVIEVIYEKQEKPKKKIHAQKIASIDIGLNNLGALTFSHKQAPVLINGRPLKSINQYFNKKKAKLMSFIGGKGTSKKIEKLTLKRNNKVRDYLHKASRYIVNQLVSKGTTLLVIGKNDGWKQDINIGKKNNQNFVSIPHATFIKMLAYKCALEGIHVQLQEESYTSKCSFLDLESIKKHLIYKGRRLKRGVFKSKKYGTINADINGSLNIMRKAVPKLFSNGIEDVVVRPYSKVKTFL